MPRKKRKGEFVCTCRSYRFPHRFGGGKCRGKFLVRKQWNDNYGTGACKHCLGLNRDTDGTPCCDVLEGVERVEECAAWQEFVQYNEIKWYKRK